jgi:hypothetical protein
MKKFTKIGGHIYITTPEIKVQHNVLYPGLFYPRQNFEVFLGQMALEIIDGFEMSHSCYAWKCINKPWTEKRPLFPKSEAKFIPMDILEMVNS